MDFKQKLLEVAMAEIGKGEIGENNSGPDIEKYLCGLIEPPTNWCQAFVSWCLLQIFENETFDYYFSARKAFNFFRNHIGKYQCLFRSSIKIEVFESSTFIPWPGMLIYWWRDKPDGWQGHVGIVENTEYGNGKSKVTTIEGNKGKFPAKVKRVIHYPEEEQNFLGYVNITAEV